MIFHSEWVGKFDSSFFRHLKSQIDEVIQLILENVVIFWRKNYFQARFLWFLEHGKSEKMVNWTIWRAWYKWTPILYTQRSNIWITRSKACIFKRVVIQISKVLTVMVEVLYLSKHLPHSHSTLFVNIFRKEIEIWRWAFDTKS
jgi:hypothetical protein